MTEDTLHVSYGRYTHTAVRTNPDTTLEEMALECVAAIKERIEKGDKT